MSSLRRPARDSWEQQNSKRPELSPGTPEVKVTTTRSSSQLPTSQIAVPDPAAASEKYQAPYVTDDTEPDQDGYPEKLALTPVQSGVGVDNESVDMTEVSPSQDDKEKPIIQIKASPFEDDVTTNETFNSYNITNLSVPQSDLNPLSQSNISSNYQSDISLSVQSDTTQSSNSTTTKSIEELEHDFLRSGDFPVQFLRPAPDLVQLMAQVALVLGDPGTISNVKFGPQSPKKAVFLDEQTRHQQHWLESMKDPYQQSILHDRPIDGRRRDYLDWERKTSSRGSSKVNEGGTSTVRSDNASTWKGRRYSINPNMKTRQISFNLLHSKMTHGELLSFNLSMDARRDVISIGGGVADIGQSLLFHPRRAPNPRAPAMTPASSTSISSHGRYSRSREREDARKSSMSTATLSSARTSTFSTLRRCGSPNSAARTSTISNNHGLDDGYDGRTRRWRAQGVDGALETGRYGMGGMMLWRLVRVVAVVRVQDVDDTGRLVDRDSEQVAWYCVPDRSMGGWF